MALLIELRAKRVRIEAIEDRLHVDAPIGGLTEELRLELRTHRNELLALPRPYLLGDTLIDPAYAPPQYFWQPLSVTLRELGAPPEVWRYYTSEPYPEPV